MKILVTFLALLMFSCLQHVAGESQHGTTTEESAAIISQCQELSKIGNVKELSQEIDLSMMQIEKLLQQKDLTQVEETIRELATQVKDNSNLLVSIIDSKFSVPDHVQNLNWQIKPLVYPRSMDREIWKISNYSFEKIYTWNGESPELASQFKVFTDQNQLSISLTRPATLIELCQLESSMNVIFKIEFKSDQGGRMSYKYRLNLPNKRISP